MFPLDWQENAIMDGDFTVAEDRDVVVQLGQKAVRSDLTRWATVGNRGKPLETMGKHVENMGRHVDFELFYEFNIYIYI